MTELYRDADGTSSGLPLYCPEPFNAKTLPMFEQHHAGGLIYLCHSLIMRDVLEPRYRKGYRNGYMPLHSTYMRNILGKNGWTNVRRIALQRGIVECDGYYQPGEFSKGYRFGPQYRDAKWRRRDMTDPRIAENVRKWRESDRREVWQQIRDGKHPVSFDVCEHLWRNLKRIRIDDQECIEATVAEPLANATEVAIDLIRRGEWRLKSDDHGRIHTNIVNLKKEIRPHLSVDGLRLVNCDIASSQPLFISHVLNQETGARQKGGKGSRKEGGRGKEKEGTICWHPMGMMGKIGKDLRRFAELCGNGELYRFIGKNAGLQLDYDTLKKRILIVLYDKDCHRNKLYKFLDAEFPTVMRACRRLKRHDHRRLAHLAQRTESDFIFGRCIERLRLENPDLFVSTIHDSILTTEGNGELVQGIMYDEFKKLGIHPTVRIEPC